MLISIFSVLDINKKRIDIKDIESPIEKSEERQPLQESICQDRERICYEFYHFTNLKFKIRITSTILSSFYHYAKLKNKNSKLDCQSEYEIYVMSDVCIINKIGDRFHNIKIDENLMSQIKGLTCVTIMVNDNENSQSKICLNATHLLINNYHESLKKRTSFKDLNKLITIQE
jgi:hypothetical protein